MPLDLKSVTADFTAAITRALGQRPLSGQRSPLQKMKLLGKGGNGFVIRGYVHVPETERHARLRWLVIKAPLPQELTPTSFVVSSHGLLHEGGARKEIGEIPGLGPIPTTVELPAASVLDALLAATRQVLHVRGKLQVLVFELHQERVVESPPASLSSFAEGAVRSARDLYNWCETARSLGNALLGLHRQGWIHRDVKLSNVVAQREGGFLRSLELIDLGSADRFGPGVAPSNPSGTSTVGTRSYWRPARVAPKGPGSPWTPLSAVDEDVYAYASLLARVHLGGRARHPDALFAEEIEHLVADELFQGAAPADPLAVEIRRALTLVGHLLKDDHAGSVEPLSRFLREVDGLRLSALDAMGRRRAPVTDPLGLVPDLLASLDAYIDRAQERRWCADYREADRARVLSALDLQERAPSVDLAVELLRHGYATVARGVLDELLLLPDRDPADDVRALRVYVGQILLREGDDTRAREVLRHYQARLDRAPDETLGWWIEMLRARLDLRLRKDVSPPTRPTPPSDGRPAVWLDALHAQIALHKKTPVDAALRDRLLIEVRRSPTSMGERLFLILLLALTLVQGGDLVQALRWLHIGIGEASARDYPVEYAALLVGAAHALLGFRDLGALRRQGVDVDALFETAERLSIRAADLFHQMGVGVERDNAIRVACRCAEARGGTTGITAAACWHQLAVTNIAVSQPPSTFPRLDVWTVDDPGTSRAQAHYSRHGWALERLWGTGGLSIELIRKATPEHEEGPDVGAALRDLLRRRPRATKPRHVLVIGCGTGSEVFQLADTYPEARVHGVDAFSWSIAEAKEYAAHPDWGGRCSFQCADLGRGDTLGDEGAPAKGPWDLVVMRETLAHVTFKRAFLKALRRQVCPRTEICVTDFVQRRPAGPTEWRDLLQSLGVTNLGSRDKLCGELTRAGFEIVPEPEDDPGPLRDFFVNRRTWFATSADPAAAELRGDLPSRMWVEDLLNRVIAAAETGALGWVRLVATAVGDDPEPSSDEPAERSFSGLVLPSPTMAEPG